MMQQLSVEIGVPITVCGPDVHMTSIVRQGLETLHLPLPAQTDDGFEIKLKPQPAVEVCRVVVRGGDRVGHVSVYCGRFFIIMMMICI